MIANPEPLHSKFKPANPLYRWLRPLIPALKGRPPVGWVNFGSLGRLNPVSEEFGYDRGSPVDRYYIESFLANHASDIQGRVLEIGDDSYTRQFGGERVAVCDILHVNENNPIATYIGDLTNAEHIPDDTFDCFILTQTLHLIYDFHAALDTIYRILKPGGVLLATVPGISQISNDEWANCWYWAFTTLSVQRLLAEAFPADCLQIEAHGNVLAATAFLQGLSWTELTRKELDYHDPCYQLLITIRAVKPEEAIDAA